MINNYNVFSDEQLKEEILGVYFALDKEATDHLHQSLEGLKAELQRRNENVTSPKIL